jgi:putative transposase
MGLRHRKGIKGGCFFITTSVIGHIPVFADCKCAMAIRDCIELYRQKYQFELKAYVIMPTHIHMILILPDNTALSNVMRDLKKYSSVQIKRIIAENITLRAISRALAQYVPNNPKWSFKLWQDRFDDVYLFSEEIYNIKMNYIRNNPVKAGLCQRPEDFEWSSFFEKSRDY